MKEANGWQFSDYSQHYEETAPEENVGGAEFRNQDTFYSIPLTKNIMRVE